jgi:glycosyltransferase involved in cell wall biosynthesis
LLEGYHYSFVRNISKKPGSDHYSGIDNPTLIGEIVSWKADAVLVYGWNFKSHLECMRHFHKKIPVYFRGDSTLLNKLGLGRKILRQLFLKWVYSFIDLAFYAGKYNKAYFLNAGLKENQLVFMPHAVDNERFHAASMSSKEHKVDLEDIVFLYAGKFAPVKNLAFLIKAFLKRKNKNLRLVLTGSGPLENELRMMASEDPKISFLPFQNQEAMPDIYSLCDIFILPSISETWGLAVNEAMACEKAVIVSDHCGCSADLVNHDNGFIFDPENQEALVNVFNRAEALGKEKLYEMGKESWKRIQNYSIKIQAEAIERSLL